ncbi:MAG: prolyl oligopeptidase family serine peptidase [Armatimonadetes bacterium]|nr:prolyl oligopeptidase family serine peptidase [Armatimonadota bacterium]
MSILICRTFAIALILASTPSTCVHAASPAGVSPLEVSLPSGEPSGNSINDRLRLAFYPAIRSAERPAPAVVLLHALGERHLRLMRRFARYLAGHGIAGAVMTLPYHMSRCPPGERPGGRFTHPDVDRMVQALSQSAADVSTAVTWLTRQPGVDPHRIGAVGISLGAIIVHLAMGEDERLTAGVAIMGGGNLADLRRTSLVFKLRRDYAAEPLSPGEEARLRQADPLHYADRNRPRRVLMIQAARDLIIPPRDALVLWEALGRPPIQWVDTNHFALGLTPRSVMAASAAYLYSVWREAPLAPGAVPTIRVPTLKTGLVFGLDAAATPAIEWQAYSFSRRHDHLSRLHADLGWSGRGPFVGLAATLNAYLDIGLGHRLGGDNMRPYASLHIVF